MLDVVVGSSQSLRRCELFEPLRQRPRCGEELASCSRRRTLVAGEMLLSENSRGQRAVRRRAWSC